jgi:hypothetical protein
MTSRTNQPVYNLELSQCQEELQQGLRGVFVHRYILTGTEFGAMKPPPLESADKREHLVSCSGVGPTQLFVPQCVLSVGERLDNTAVSWLHITHKPDQRECLHCQSYYLEDGGRRFIRNATGVYQTNRSHVPQHRHLNLHM